MARGAATSARMAEPRTRPLTPKERRQSKVNLRDVLLPCSGAAPSCTMAAPSRSVQHAGAKGLLGKMSWGDSGLACS